MRLKLFFFSIFVIFCAAFHKQAIGTAARYILLYSNECQLGYRSIYWKGGELVFSDVILADSSFHAHIDRASIDFNWDQFPKKMKVHLTLNDPHVAVMKKRSLPESKPGWVEFTVSAINGTLDWDGAANFSFDQTHMFLDWGHCSAFVAG